jgi:DNA-binding NarL/FixJ family response regulator
MWALTMTMASNNVLRVVLIDDHTVFREGLAALLAQRREFSVVGQAGTAHEAFALVEREHPDVILLDLSLPDATGLDVARELQRRVPRCKILVLTMHADRALIDEALGAGVTGYAVKSEPADAIARAIQVVSRRELYLPSASSPPGHAVAPRDDGLATLSRREREIFELVVRGLSNEEVAQRLCISVKTVETHRARINRKCQVHSTAALVRIAARMGMFA